MEFMQRFVLTLLVSASGNWFFSLSNHLAYHLKDKDKVKVQIQHSDRQFKEFQVVIKVSIFVGKPYLVFYTYTVATHFFIL